MLQARSARRVDVAGSGTEEEETEVQTHQYQHAGATVRIDSDSNVAVFGRGQWVISIKEGCTNSDVDKMAEHMPEDTAPVYKGHPDEGGFCMFIMEGTKAGVEKELDTHTWPHPPLVEADKNISAIPEIPSDESDESDSLLQAGSGKPESWGLDRIDDKKGLDNSYSAPANTKEGAGVHVYVLDTGVHVAHEDFEGRAIPAFDVTGSSDEVCSATSTTCARDIQGHGTHCAGTVAGKKYGVAKKAQIYGVKVLGDNGSGSFAAILRAIEWVTMNGKRPAIMSMSLGGKGTMQTAVTAIDKAAQQGVPVVVAAGNSGRTSTPDACKYTPAFVPSAITVGATDKPSGGSDRRASYSSYGTCLDIYAPGSDIISAEKGTRSGTDKMSGTSMACPHVAGATALLLAENPQLSVTEIVTKLTSTGIKGIISDAKTGSPNIMLYTGVSTPAGPPTPVPTPAPTPVAPCGFEKDKCGIWSDATDDDFDWDSRSGATPSSGTGPSSAAEGAKYMYVESSSPRKKGEKAVLRSNPLTIPGAYVMSFKYNMNGNCMGDLEVMVDGVQSFKKTGDQGADWKTADVALAAGGGAVVEFVGTVGSCYRADVSIDDIQFKPSAGRWRS